MADGNDTRACVQCGVDGCERTALSLGMCGLHYSRHRAGKPIEGPTKWGQRVSISCEYCGAAMSVTPRLAATRKTCSKQCNARVLVAKKGQTLRVPVVVACHGCGVSAPRVVKLKDAGRYCSRKCNTDALARIAKERQALRRIADAWAWRPSQRVLDEVAALRRIGKRTIRQYRTERGCTHCGTPVVGLLNWKRMCKPCKAAAHRRQVRIAKATRKARMKGVRRDSIDPIAVFERAGWLCYICGDETPRFLRGTCEPSAPELEHIVALANGGTHTWDNVDCACRSCNQAKGAKLTA